MPVDVRSGAYSQSRPWSYFDFFFSFLHHLFLILIPIPWKIHPKINKGFTDATSFPAPRIWDPGGSLGDKEEERQFKWGEGCSSSARGKGSEISRHAKSFECACPTPTLACLDRPHTAHTPSLLYGRSYLGFALGRCFSFNLRLKELN